MLVSAILNAAARKVGVIASGETLTTAEYADALVSLQSMLRSWAAEKVNLFATTRETFTLVSGTATYTWGSGGAITTTRPDKIEAAFISDSSGQTHPIEIIGSGRYNAITVKASIGRPDRLFPQYSYPLASISLYPVPVLAETLNLESTKQFTETSSFSAIGDTLAMPLHYEEPIIYNLAVRLAPEFGVDISREVISIADKSYTRLVNLNSANYIETVGINIPAGSSARYNINAG